MKERLEKEIAGILAGFGIPDAKFIVEHPADFSHGDYSTNVAMVVAKEKGENPRELAEKISHALQSDLSDIAEKIEVAGPGFINIYLNKKFFENVIHDVINQGENYGLNGRLKSQKTAIEFTSPNLFKRLHAGHVLSNSIGEALCRIAEWNGAEVKRVVYSGDTGLGIAKAVWGMVQNRAGMPQDDASISDKIKFVSDSYVFGTHEYDADDRAKKEMEVTNKMIFEKSNHEINVFYEKGRDWSLDFQKIIYDRLGTNFDLYFYESEIGPEGKKLVEENIENGIFEESDGAVVYKGERDGLHTRVFINSLGLPVYEAKEVALSKAKYEKYPYERSIILTGNDIVEYFKVVLSAMIKTLPDLADKTTHISHGILRLPSGKMSSRKGTVVTAEDFINDVKARIVEKMADRDFDTEAREAIAEDVAIAALKYAILKQAPGKDVIFDINTSISFEGDSGPYLQYTAIRAKALLDKAAAEGVSLSQVSQPEGWEVTEVERLLNRFPEVVMSAYDELAPQVMVRYLTDLAGAFNSFYGNNKIVDVDDKQSSAYKIGIAEAVYLTLKNGIHILGMKLPERM